MPENPSSNDDNEQQHCRCCRTIIKNCSGKWRNSSKSRDKNGLTLTKEILTKYKNYPLVRDMLTHEEIRTATLEADGAKQTNYTKSSDGWFRTIFVLEGRALDKFFFPWMLVTLNAIVWTTVVNSLNSEWMETDLVQEGYESSVILVLNTALAFLLVFRLNRSATRYWDCRRAWGYIVGLGRTMVGGLLIHGQHNPIHRDGAIRWIATFSVATMQLISREGSDEVKIDSNYLAGILGIDEVKEMETNSQHFGIYALEQVRWYLQQTFQVDEKTSFPIAQAKTQQFDTLEKQLNELTLHMGTLERIRATPLPLVYVAHLRTFLLLFLLSLPYYIGVVSLGYGMIPVVFLSGFALLGLDGAAQEMEAPFLKNRTNHLNMNAFCLLLIKNIQQQIKQNADRDIKLNKEAQKESSSQFSGNNKENDKGTVSR